MSQSYPTADPSLERRTVVSVLIFPHRPQSSRPFRVLLFRRSAKVRTYQNKLAPVAGSVEVDDKDPLAAAWRELKEETGFGPQQLELWRRGIGFEFTDQNAVSTRESAQRKGRIWRVWPFAFCLKKTVPDHDGDVNKLGLELDWEHTGCEWKAVYDVLEGKILHDCVPKLEVTLAQLWVDPSSALHQKLEALRLDHEHGARELATMAIRSLSTLVEHSQATSHADDLAAWWECFRQQAFHLAFNARPSMGAAISSAIAMALKDIKSIIEVSQPNALDRVQQSLNSSIARRGRISQQVSDQFSTFLQHWFTRSQHEKAGTRSVKILTLSSSSTIKAAILHALDADASLSIELRILESRPLNEGARFAQDLTDEAQKRREKGCDSTCFHDRLRIILASDASVGLLSRGIDLVVIGADRISAAGDVSNKTGSLAAVLVSKTVTNDSVQVVCISETEKIAVPGIPEEHLEEDNAEEELNSGWQLRRSALWNEMVTVRNVYFEWCAADYIDRYICEHGILSTNDIRQKSKETAALIETAFPLGGALKSG
jgi:translation initiation factor 2B subunit (eIF-2B alpha/beta/delta family)/8-oxo-dGTP pyrophosphatase MutT (NUDIX family)